MRVERPTSELSSPRLDLRGWNRPWSWFVTVLILLAWLGLCFWGRSYDAKISRENGPMENFQIICLTAGALTLGYYAVRTDDRGRKVLFAGLSLFYASFLILELDVRHWGIKWLTPIFNGWPRNLWLGLAWIAAGVGVMRNRVAVQRAFLAWFGTFPAAILLMAGVGWVLGSLIDKSLLGQKSLFNEELCEVAATWLMLQSAVLTRK